MTAAPSLLVLLVAAAVADAPQGSPLSARPQAPLATTVAGGDAAVEPLTLTLREAVERGLKSNLEVLLGREDVRAAQGRREQDMGALLPHLALTSGVNLQQLNVRAQEGIEFPGLPSVIGPFTNFDTRVRLTQSIFDLPSVLRARADTDALRAAEYDLQDARDHVILTVGAAYLQTVAHAARVRSAETQHDTAAALHAQAVDRLDAGTAAAIDVSRAQVQLQTRQQQLIAARNDLAKQKLALARLIGLPLSQSYTVGVQRWRGPARNGVTDDGLRRALASRADYQALAVRTRGLELQRKAASARSAPGLSLSLDYGAVGVTPASASRTVGGFAAIRIPLFQGGEIRAELAQASAALARSRAQLDDLRVGIEQDVRSATLDLQSAAEQARVAASMVDLADRTLQQARDRFAAGVTDNIEVLQAQEAVADASEKLIASEYAYGVAALELARATGNAESALSDLLEER